MEGNLSSTLWSLEIFNYTSNSNEVDNVLDSLTSCRRLRNLELHWKLYDGHYYSVGSDCSTEFFKHFSRKSVHYSTIIKKRIA